MNKASTDLNQEPVSKTLPILANSAQIVLSRGADGRALASSLDIAERFGKRHDRVLRAIDNMLEAAPESLPNFGECSYVAENGRKERCYTMDRDGFSLVVMGFTGPEAIRWKLAYIAAFNAMEAELNEPPMRRIARRRSKGEIAQERAVIARIEADTARIQADAARFVQEATRATALGYADMLQSALKMDANAAFIAGCKAAKAAHGIDIMASTAITHLDSESQQVWHTPTDLGKMENGLSAVKINQMLVAAGLQTKPDGKQWELTEKGKKYGRVLDTGKKHSSGAPVTQIKWCKDVLDMIAPS